MSVGYDMLTTDNMLRKIFHFHLQRRYDCCVMKYEKLLCLIEYPQPSVYISVVNWFRLSSLLKAWTQLLSVCMCVCVSVCGSCASCVITKHNTGPGSGSTVHVFIRSDTRALSAALRLVICSSSTFGWTSNTRHNQKLSEQVAEILSCILFIA